MNWLAVLLKNIVVITFVVVAGVLCYHHTPGWWAFLVVGAIAELGTWSTGKVK